MVMVFHMKLSIISLIVLSVSSFAANAMSVSQAQKNVDAAEAGIQAAHDFAIHNTGQGHKGMHRDVHIMNVAATHRAQAYADLRTAQENAANAVMAQHQQDIKNYGIKGNPNLVSQVNVPGYVVSKHPPFAGESWSNGRGANNGSHDHSGTGNGSNNAANSHSAHGLGGGDHIGGGRSGGGYHY